MNQQPNNNSDYFPRGLALGKAFCNRVKERQTIKDNITSGVHTIIKSSRRYGKTSLVIQSLSEMSVAYGEADFFVTVNTKQVEKEILNAIKDIIKQICTPVEQGLKIIRSYLANKTSQWTIGTHGVDLAIFSGQDSDPASNILDALLALEDLLSNKKQKAVIFIDEMQEIGKLPEGKSIEGAIRHVAQKTKYLTFIFSGSNRHLLTQMFEDHSRPLYKLCYRMQLSRISIDHYIKHLNTLANKRWGKSLPKEIVESIGDHTEWHPYYVNILCAELWKRHHLPTTEAVEKEWLELSRAERLEVMNALTNLSTGQKKILIGVAKGYQSKLTGKDFLQKVNLTSSSVVEAINALEFHDYIEKKEAGLYHLIDPMVRSTINIHFNDYDL